MKNILKTFSILFPLAVLLLMMQCKTMPDSAPADEKIMIIASYTRDCTGVAPMKCLQVKEKETDNWENFYSNIEGFTYEPGFEYVLKVQTRKMDNPPVDHSSMRFILIQQVSKTKK